MPGSMIMDAWIMSPSQILRSTWKRFNYVVGTEGIIPALEPAHALAHVAKIAPTMDKEQIIVMNLCGRATRISLLWQMRSG